MRNIILTKHELIQAFKAWNTEISENPDKFDLESSYSELNASEQANYLIEKIDEIKGQK